LRPFVGLTAFSKSPKLLRDLTDASGEGWTVHYAFFAHAGFTDAARSLAQDHETLLVDLDRLDRDLQTAGVSGSRLI
jgi:hypothetical protein